MLRVNLDSPHRTETPVFRHIGVVGAGLMGRQIALAHLGTVRDVTLFDASNDALAAAVEWIGDRRALAGGTVRTTATLEPLAGCDLIIEAVPEDLAAKRRVLSEISRVANAGAIVGSNTSSLPIDRLAVGFAKPSQLCGIHFCHPLDQRRLVEVIPGLNTASETTKQITAHVRQLGRVPVIAADRPGFLLNRILMPYLAAALDLLDGEGCELRDIESAARMIGMPVGPFAFLDAIGLDTAVRVGMTIYEAIPDRFRPSGLLVALYKKGQLGEKTGAGFLLHDGNGETINPAVTRLLNRTTSNSRLPLASIAARLLKALETEALDAILSGAATAEDVSTVLCHGVGFEGVLAATTMRAAAA